MQQELWYKSPKTSYLMLWFTQISDWVVWPQVMPQVKKRTPSLTNRIESTHKTKEKCPEERNKPKLKHNLSNPRIRTLKLIICGHYFSQVSSYCEKNHRKARKTCYIKGRHWKWLWSTPAENPIGRVASATKSSNLRMMNFLTYPPPVPLRHAMKLAEDSLNQLQAAKDELCKPKLRWLIKENDSTHFNELSKTINSIHKN